LYKSKAKDAEKQKPEPSEMIPPVDSSGN